MYLGAEIVGVTEKCEESERIWIEVGARGYLYVGMQYKIKEKAVTRQTEFTMTFDMSK